MKLGLKSLTAVLGGSLFCVVAEAADSGQSISGFSEIAALNPFRLRPPPQPPADEKPSPPAPKLTLKGIVTFQGIRRVLLNALMPAGKPGEQARDESYVLAEGQRVGDIEVLLIDEQAGAVTLNSFGTRMTVNFAQNGAPPPGLPAALPQPGGPPPAPAGPEAQHRPRAVPTRFPGMPTIPNGPPPAPGNAAG